MITHVEPALEEWGMCCIGAAAMGRCTCWEPIYGEKQARPKGECAPPKPRVGCCGTCGAVDGMTEELGIDDAAATGRAFYCHIGLRRIVAWRHPDGRTKPGAAFGYVEAFGTCNGAKVLLKADGTTADLCGAWVKWAREAGHTWFDEGVWPPPVTSR